ncbi:MAG: AMP-binding protein, partial [bacterium]|nr:AMP-binding protein [bacterium]
QSFEGNVLDFTLEPREAKALKQKAVKEQTTVYMMLLTIYYILLSKLSGQEDIVVGTPVAGRTHPEAEPLIGMFVNTLPLKNHIDSEKNYSGLLKEISASTLEAFENQDYQLQELVEHLEVERDASRNPLFDVMFDQQNTGPKPAGTKELPLKPLKYYSDIAKFDITVSVVQNREQLEFELEYSTKLFKEETIKRIIRYFKKITGHVLLEPLQKIHKIEIISPEEKEKILLQFNETGTRYPKEKTIHELFEEQARLNPDRTAAVGIAQTPGSGPHTLTYKKLNEISNRQANILKAKGIKQKSIVGIMAESTPETLTAILGILKAGGAYMPLNVNYP